MSDNYEVMQTFGFTYTDCEGKTYKKEIQTSGATWMECLNDYVRFLESIFQYQIMPKVRLEEPKFLDMMYEHYPDYNDPWKGQYFVKDEDTESTQEELDW